MEYIPFIEVIVEEKMIFVVDGDNSPGANIHGIKELGETDYAYIYYASNNRYYGRPDTQKDLLSKVKCRVSFIKIDAADNAVDFAIAMDIRSILENNPSEIIVLISDDCHFKTILSQARKTAGSSNLYLASEIDQAVSRYKMLESQSLIDLHNCITKSFGQKQGSTFYNSIENLFFEKFKKMEGNHNGVKDKKKKTGKKKYGRHTFGTWIEKIIKALTIFFVVC